ncbi:hypothetical protein [Leptolyngbya sp. NIES-2104]|uniref:hypothetical protein n=1 Tax=Leptolyngbya sp. NIES-2104 TaxID=1552121 RepID=UPI0006EC5550|nr:hypothetical protein [Leptolyngbya sp. NIES-2104]GAP95473.1 hypothetical protein NIES2104_19950 [Leptolyngbya sp. NIES-2104]
MNLSPALEREIREIASLQGISPEDFISQTLLEKISSLKQQAQKPSELPSSHLREKDGILVFDTDSLEHIDFNLLIQQSREDCDQE